MERAGGSLIEKPLPEPEQKEDKVKEKQFEVYLVDRVLRETIAQEFGGQFREQVQEMPKEKRPEALLNFKVDYLKHQLNLTDVIVATQDFVKERRDFTVPEFEQQVDLKKLSSAEKAQALVAVQSYENQSRDLKDLVHSFFLRDQHGEGQDRIREAKKAAFAYLTGFERGLWGQTKLKRIGNNLIWRAHPADFAELYAGSTEGDVRRSMKDASDAAVGFHRVERRKHPTDDREITFHTIAIKLGRPSYDFGSFYHFDPNAIDKTTTHELQHAFDSSLDMRGGNVNLEFPAREDLEKHLSGYVGGYLENLRDEAIAYAVEGRGSSLAGVGDHMRKGGFYFYPTKEQLEPYRKLLGEEKFGEWKVDALWEERVVKPFTFATKGIARVSARLASTPQAQRRKLAALFEIEPAQKWGRLERWIDDVEVRERLGRRLPKLAPLPKRFKRLQR